MRYGIQMAGICVLCFLPGCPKNQTSDKTDGDNPSDAIEYKQSKSPDYLMGNLGHPLGTYLTIEGYRSLKVKSNTNALTVDTVNGEKLGRTIGIVIRNVRQIPMDTRCILRGYESGMMIGVPDEVARKENLPITQAAWQFFRFFVATSVIEPAELGLEKNF